MTQMFITRLYKSLFCGALLTYLIAILFDLKSFQMWSQVQILHEMGLQINLKSIYLHPHGMRYLLVSPVYLISDLTQVAPDKILSLFVVSMCVTISIALTHVVALFQRVKNYWELNFYFFLFFAILSLFMNGRLIYGLCAYSLMAYSFFLLMKGKKEFGIKKQILPACLITLGILFSSISSGVAISFYAICFSSICLYLFYSYRHKIKFNYPIIIYMSVLFLLYTPIILCLLNKNLSFFGEGYEAILSMTQHGTLSGLGNDQVSNVQDPGVGNYLIFRVLGIGFTSLLICFVYIYRSKVLHDPLTFFPAYCMALVILLSPFAFSILMMGFIPAIMMFAFLTSQFSVVGKYFFESYQASVPNRS